MLKAVIFDIGGVVVRTEDHSGREKLQKLYGRDGLSVHDMVFESVTADQATTGEVTEADVWESLAKKLDLDPTRLAEFQRDFWSGDRADQELVAFIQSLRPRYKTAWLSNAWGEARQALQANFGLGPITDLMVISAEEKMAKPDHRIYYLTAERLGVKPEEAVFIDDKAANIEAARATGMQALRFFNTPQLLAELRQLLEL